MAIPIIDIQPALKQPQNYFYAAEAKAIDAKASQSTAFRFSVGVVLQWCAVDAVVCCRRRR